MLFKYERIILLNVFRSAGERLEVRNTVLYIDCSKRSSLVQPVYKRSVQLDKQFKQTVAAAVLITIKKNIESEFDCEFD